MQESSAQFDKVDLKAKDLVKLHFVATQQPKNKQQIVAGVAGISHDTTNLESRISILEDKLNKLEAGLAPLVESAIKGAMSTMQDTITAELAKALQAHSHQ
ncbi:hypothetical protein QWA68_015708 [Fusarium oxysporum]|nr:hypothetical protein QWA68_015708 [Fusarium oxysporum]